MAKKEKEESEKDLLTTLDTALSAINPETLENRSNEDLARCVYKFGIFEEKYVKDRRKDSSPESCEICTKYDLIVDKYFAEARRRDNL